MRVSPRKQLMKQLGSFSLRDSKGMPEIEQAKSLYDLMCANDREEEKKIIPRRRRSAKELKETAVFAGKEMLGHEISQ